VVVFEAGAGESRLTWSPVFLALATDTKVFAYDRPGSMSNSTIANPYTPDEDGLTSPVEAVAYLRGLLADAGLRPPYVLVAHSLGGGYALKFAQLYPEEVAGVIMVDARVPTVEATCRAMLSDYPALCEPTPMSVLASAPAYVRAEIAGLAPWEAGGPRAESLGDMPISFIAATEIPAPPPEQSAQTSRDRASPIRSIPAEARARDAEAFRIAQRDYAEAAAGGRYVEATGAGHYVHQQQPQLVIDEVRALLVRVRGRMAGAP
jgi:pimeloyl-ACP methyl ester carboxylesterase